MDARGKLEEHERSVWLARGKAEYFSIASWMLSKLPKCILKSYPEWASLVSKRFFLFLFPFLFFGGEGGGRLTQVRGSCVPWIKISYYQSPGVGISNSATWQELNTNWCLNGGPIVDDVIIIVLNILFLLFFQFLLKMTTELSFYKVF